MPQSGRDMIPNDLLTRMANALRLDPARLLTAEPSSRTLQLPWAVGEKVTAIVHENIGAGRTLALVGDLPLNLKLPFPVKPGERFELTLMAKQPSPLFSLADSSAGAATKVQSVQLSRAAQLVGQLVPNARQAPVESELMKRTQQAGAPPLLTAPTADIAKIAQALKQGVSESGLFYESHQAQWVQGDRPRDALLREPQGKLPPLQFPTQSMRADPVNDHPLTRDSIAASSVNAEVASTKPAPDMVHSQAIPQIQQQLQTLDSHRIIWLGQPWPGLALEWRIEDPPQREGSETQALTWNTRLNLSLPDLGAVEARLALSGTQIRLQLSVENTATRQRLLGDQGYLTQSLAGAGLQLGQFAVDADGQG